jgi:glyoxylase-like metal-dependent hydrolase (beta-lactamase superfamily II)
MREIAKSIFVETGFCGCNPSVVVTREGLVLIDTPYLPTDALQWREELRELGNVKYIVNTEGHVDHVLGNSFFEGVVISHQGTREHFGASGENLDQIKERIRELDPKGMTLLEDYLPKKPAVTFDHHLNLYLDNRILNLVHLPGHSSYQVAVYLPEDKVIFTGDNVVSKTRPFYHDCKPREWMESLKTLRTMEFDILVPGHGEVCDRQAIDEMIAYNEEVFGQVQRAIERGLSKDETAETVEFDDRMPLAEYQREFGHQLGQLGILRIYEELISISN